MVSIFRRKEKDGLRFGVWMSDRFLGEIGIQEGLSVCLPEGNHRFFAGNLAQSASGFLPNYKLHAGISSLELSTVVDEHYYLWFDHGKNRGNVRITPVNEKETRKLEKWLKATQWFSLDESALTNRFSERVDIVLEALAASAADGGS